MQRLILKIVETVIVSKNITNSTNVIIEKFQNGVTSKILIT
tara:strand:+ start:38 stop:160 length:123 start_codon:yes stop_codon:yes gene_type:complete